MAQAIEFPAGEKSLFTYRANAMIGENPYQGK